MSRFEVFKRDKFTCQYCGRRPPTAELELEHVQPLSRGGGNEPWNLVTSCHDCNRGKLARLLTTEQLRRIDGDVPNVIAQLMAVATVPGVDVVQELFDISCGAKLFGEWIVGLDALYTSVMERCNALVEAESDT